MQNEKVLIEYKGKKIPVSLSALKEAYQEALRKNREEVVLAIPGKKRTRIIVLPREKVKETLIKSEKVEPSELEQIPPSSPSQIVLNEEVLEKFKPKEKIEEEEVSPQSIVLTPKRESKIRYNEEVQTEYSPTFLDRIRQRVKTVFEPLFSESTYNKVNYKTKYKPRLSIMRKSIYQPRNYYKFYEDYTYEPHYSQVENEDFTPKDKEVLSYNPQVEQESYPVFTYATYGLPDTYIDQYAPEESVKIKPITEFEIKAKPKPLIVSQTHLILLNKLINEVTK